MSQGTTIEQQPQQQKDQQGAPPGNRSQLVQRLLDPRRTCRRSCTTCSRRRPSPSPAPRPPAFLIERGGRTASVGAPPDRPHPPATRAPPRSAPPPSRRSRTSSSRASSRARTARSKSAAATTPAEAQFCLVTLLRSEGEVVAASARHHPLPRPRARPPAAEACSSSPATSSCSRSAATATSRGMVAQSHQHVLQLATAVATAEGFESAAMNLCNELATRAGATRVSLGWLKGKQHQASRRSRTPSSSTRSRS